MQKKPSSGDDGQSMVEFAIVFPILFLFFLTIIQTALLMTAKQVVNYAAFCSARAAAVEYDEDKIARAAQIACIPISPRVTQLDELWDYYAGLVTSALDVTDIISTYPELAAELVAIRDKIPGLDILSKFNNLNLSSVPGLIVGLEFMDTFCGFHQEVPSRFVTSFLLTGVDLSYPRGGDDVTAEVTHNYALRIPVINKVFFFMYLNFWLQKEVSDTLSGLPQPVIDIFRQRAFDGISALADSGSSLPLYLIPIKASCTLMVEKEVSNGKCCS